MFIGYVALYFGLCHALWQSSFAAQPNPGKRDLENLDYFVVEVANPNDLANINGWTVEEPFPIENHWLMSANKSNTDFRTIFRRSAEAGALNVYESPIKTHLRRAPVPFKQLAKEMEINDPLFKDQWFIYNQEQPGHDMNVAPVWERNITGKGVTVAIVDDGLDYDHPDFKKSFSLDGSWDYNLHQQHPKPLLDIDTHGTRCAGEIAADINGVCGVGIAFDSKVSGIRILSGQLTLSDEARSLIHKYHINDIYSCSWGPNDDGRTIDGPPPIVRRAELEGIENGRHGRGSIYVVASGNGDTSGDNCNYDGYTNSIYSITVSAVDRFNQHPFYAESCSANMVVTYSSNYYDKITTCDRLDPFNPSEAKCTNRHSGTSAAAPIAAAVFALVLEQRPELTWRDLQYLCRKTAKHFDIQEATPPTPPNPDQSNWQATIDGKMYHNSYGYGLLDADEIVREAEKWELVKPQTWYFANADEENAEIHASSKFKHTVTEEDWKNANMDHIEHVRLKISYEYPVRGFLDFTLVSPNGIRSHLAAKRSKDTNSHPVVNWEFMTVVHWFEQGAGDWTLEIEGVDSMVGKLTSWQLKFFGQAKDVSKVKRYSEVWNDYERPVDVVREPNYVEEKPSQSIDAPQPTQSDKNDNENDKDGDKDKGGNESQDPNAQPTSSADPQSQPPSEEQPKSESSDNNAPPMPVETKDPTDSKQNNQDQTPPEQEQENNGNNDEKPSEEDEENQHTTLWFVVIFIVIALIISAGLYAWFSLKTPNYVQLGEDYELETLNDHFEIEDEEEEQ